MGVLLCALAFCSATQAANFRIGATSYAWSGSSIEQMAKDLKPFGVKDFFIFAGSKLSVENPIKFSPKLDKKGRDTFKEFFKKYGIKPTGYGHVRTAKEDEIKSLFEFAKDMGIETLCIEAPKESLPIYEKYSKGTGVKVGLYNHSTRNKSSAYPRPENMLEATKGLKYVKCFPDIGHWARSDLDQVECLETLEGHMYNVHMQDVTFDNKDCAIFGTGKSNLKGVLKELKRQNFKGVLFVMFTKKPDAISYMGPCIKYLQNFKD